MIASPVWLSVAVFMSQQSPCSNEGLRTRPFLWSGSSKRGTTLVIVRSLKMSNEGDLKNGTAREMKCPRCIEKKEDHDVSHWPICWTMRP
jgi:hypothetical protein